MVQVFMRDVIHYPTFDAVQWWGKNEQDIVCVYAKTSEYEYYSLLEDIEVRPGFRHRGIAKDTLQEIGHLTQKLVFSRGIFTPTGAKSLKGFLPLAPSHQFQFLDKERNFVEDWDNFVAEE